MPNLPPEIAAAVESRLTKDDMESYCIARKMPYTKLITVGGITTWPFDEVVLVQHLCDIIDTLLAGGADDGNRAAVEMRERCAAAVCPWCAGTETETGVWKVSEILKPVLKDNHWRHLVVTKFDTRQCSKKPFELWELCKAAAIRALPLSAPVAAGEPGSLCDRCNKGTLESKPTPHWPGRRVCNQCGGIYPGEPDGGGK